MTGPDETPSTPPAEAVEPGHRARALAASLLGELTGQRRSSLSFAPQEPSGLASVPRTEDAAPAAAASPADPSAPAATPAAEAGPTPPVTVGTPTSGSPLTASAGTATPSGTADAPGATTPSGSVDGPGTADAPGPTDVPGPTARSGADPSAAAGASAPSGSSSSLGWPAARTPADSHAPTQGASVQDAPTLGASSGGASTQGAPTGSGAPGGEGRPVGAAPSTGPVGERPASGGSPVRDREPATPGATTTASTTATATAGLAAREQTGQVEQGRSGAPGQGQDIRPAPFAYLAVAQHHTGPARATANGALDQAGQRISSRVDRALVRRAALVTTEAASLLDACDLLDERARAVDATWSGERHASTEVREFEGAWSAFYDAQGALAQHVAG